MKFNLVEFACTKNDTPEYLALTEKQYDSYVNGEPQEGYHTFLWKGEVTLTTEVINEVYETEDEIRMNETKTVQSPILLTNCTWGKY